MRFKLFSLHAKHWKVFLLLFGPMFLFYVVPMMVILWNMMIVLGDLENNMSSSFESIVPRMISWQLIFGGITVLLSLIPIFWKKNVTESLHKFIIPSMQFDLWRFRLCTKVHIVLITLIAVLLISFGIYLMQNNSLDLSMLNDHTIRKIMPYYFVFVVMMMLFSFCILAIHLYEIYITAKAIRTVELQKPFASDSILIDGILLYFLPIGIWFLQPRINALAAKYIPKSN